MSCGIASLKREEVAQLFERYKAGDDSAGWSIVQSTEGWMTTLIARDIHGEVVADVRSELAMILYKSLRNYDPAKSSISTFTHTIWQRRRIRILAQYLPRKNVYEYSEPGEFKIDDLGYELEDDQCTVTQELNDTVELDEVAKYAFRLRAREFNREKIAKKIASEFPNYFISNDIKRSHRETHVGQLIDHVAAVLGARLGYTPANGSDAKPRQQITRSEKESTEMPACNLTSATDDQFVSVIRLLFTPSSVNGLVRAFRRHGVLVSHHGIEGLLSRFEIERRIQAVAAGESIDSHLAEILGLRHHRPKRVRPAKEPKPNPELRLINDSSWAEIEKLLPQAHLKLTGIRERISAIVQRHVDGLTWRQACALVNGGNLRPLHETLSDIGAIEQIKELATTRN